MIWQNDAVHTPQDCGGAACFKAFRMLESTRHPSGEANTAEQELDVACARQCSAHLWRKVSLREILWSDPGKQRSGYVWIDLNNAAFQWYSVILNMWLITLGFHVFFAKDLRSDMAMRMFIPILDGWSRGRKRIRRSAEHVGPGTLSGVMFGLVLPFPSKKLATSWDAFSSTWLSGRGRGSSKPCTQSLPLTIFLAICCSKQSLSIRLWRKQILTPTCLELPVDPNNDFLKKLLDWRILRFN